MTEVIYDTHLLESGPWLLPEAALVKLDEIVNTEWSNLGRRRETLVEARVAASVERRQKLYPDEQLDEKILSELRQDAELLLGKDERRLKILCRGGKSISVATFAEAFRSPEAMNERPKAFSFHMRCADVRAEVELREYNGAVSISVSPVEASEARELFVELRRWVLEFKPPRWQQIWRQSLGAHWVIWLFAIWLSSLVVTSTPDSSRQAAIAKGRQLLTGGLSDQEVRQAVEVLLQISVGQKTEITPTPSWLKLLFFGGLGMAVLLSVAPRSSIAVGKGVQAVRFWRSWTQFVGITLPLFLFSTFAWPYLETLVRSLL